MSYPPFVIYGQCSEVKMVGDLLTSTPATADTALLTKSENPILKASSRVKKNRSGLEILFLEG